MELDLPRWKFSNKSAIGSLSINGVFECYTIEDPDRGLTQSMSLEEIQRIKIAGTTCIPYGRYEVIMAQSPRLSAKKGKNVITPRLLDVPGFDGILIHIANFATEIKGCIGVGTSYEANVVWDSKNAFDALCKKINAAFQQKEKIYINITRANSEPRLT